MDTSSESNTQPPPLPPRMPQNAPVATQPQKKTWLLPVIIISSLILVVGAIGAVGIIAAIAIPNIGQINEAAYEAKDRRNAQNLASVFAAANAAGLDFSNPNGDITKTILDIAEGKVVEEVGPFEGTYFGVPNLTTEDIEGAKRFLMFDDNFLIFVADENTRVTKQKVQELRIRKAEADAARNAALPSNNPQVNPVKVSTLTLDNTTSVDEKKRRINAKKIASIYAAGQAAGAKFDAQSVDEAIVTLIEGKTIQSGPFEGSQFVVNDLSLMELQEAIQYLKFENEQLVYQQ